MLWGVQRRSFVSSNRSSYNFFFFIPVYYIEFRGRELPLLCRRWNSGVSWLVVAMDIWVAVSAFIWEQLHIYTVFSLCNVWKKSLHNHNSLSCNKCCRALNCLHSAHTNPWILLSKWLWCNSIKMVDHFFWGVKRHQSSSTWCGKL